MHALVTGAAGFIGSHLVERLLADGDTVRGVDCFTPYYDKKVKRSNIREAETHDRFELVRTDLRLADLDPLLEGVDAVFHLAAQPGVRLSWADGFQTYDEANIQVTQRLLEAARAHPLDRFVLASSSSVYGAAAGFPTHEDARCAPYSPYGVTKLAAEALAGAYARNFDIPTVILRYFTVYGPRQRPDMAITRLIDAAFSGEAFPMFGDGSQQRDFTYVGDVVEATTRAARMPVESGAIVNISSGQTVSLAEVIATVEAATGRTIRLEVWPEQPGDTPRTTADVQRAADLLGWTAKTEVDSGIAQQVDAWRAHSPEGSKR